MKSDTVDLDKIWSKVPNNMPRHKWRLVKTKDFGSFFKPNGKHDPSKGRLCTLCGRRTRFIHILGHVDWPDEITTGHDCAWYAGCIDKEDLDRAYRENLALKSGKSLPEYTWEELLMIQMQVLERLEDLERASLIAEQEREEREELREEVEFAWRQEAHRRVHNLVDEVSQMFFDWTVFKTRLIDSVAAMEDTWCDYSNWLQTSNGINLKRHVTTDFFEAGITVFQKPQGWKCVVNSPKSSASFGRYHRFENEAKAEAYILLRNGIVNTMNRHRDSFLVKCLKNYIEVKRPDGYTARVNYDLQQKGIKL